MSYLTCDYIYYLLSKRLQTASPGACGSRLKRTAYTQLSDINKTGTIVERLIQSTENNKRIIMKNLFVFVSLAGDQF